MTRTRQWIPALLAATLMAAPAFAAPSLYTGQSASQAMLSSSWNLGGGGGEGGGEGSQ